jgi:hypothetical protein
MSAQDGVNNIRGQQGLPNSIDPNFHADQLQLVVDELQETNRPLLVTNADGTRIGEIFQDETYGLVLRAKDADESQLPVTLVGSTVVVGGENTMIKFNGAQEGNFLQLGAPLDLDGNIVFPLEATPLNVEVHSETATNASDLTVTTSYQPMITYVTTKSYQPDSSSASIQFRVENSSNQARELDYYITVNGAPPTPGDEFRATVPAKSQGANGVLLISTNDSSTSLINIGDTVTCQVKADASGAVVTGTVLATKLKLTQNTSIQDSVANIESELNNIQMCDFSFSNPIQLNDTLTVLTGWGTDYPFLNVGITESGGEFTVAKGGVYKIDLERIYRNDDRSPSVPVILHIVVEGSDGAGGWIPVMDRTAPIMAATANDEPAILSFTTPALLPVPDGAVFRVRASAAEGTGSPSDTYMIRATIVATRIQGL